MDMLTFLLMAFAGLTAALAVVFAVAAVVTRCKDRSGGNMDVGFELWIYAAVFGGLFLLTAMRGGLDANYGEGWGIFVWAVPCFLCTGWLAWWCIGWLRNHSDPASALDRGIDRGSLFADPRQSPTQRLISAETQLRARDPAVLQGAGGAGLFRNSIVSEVANVAEPNAPDVRERRCKPLADAMYFRDSRRWAKLGLSITGLNWFHDRVNADDGMVVAVEARGLHVGAIGSIQAGSAFFPWASIISATGVRPGRERGTAGGGIGAGIGENYRKYPCSGGYLPIPGPLWFEDRHGFLDAVCRYAPEQNPLRRLFENALFRFIFLWLDRMMLAIAFAAPLYFFYRF